MNEVIKHNFGKEHREHVRMFARLMGLAEKMDAAILADPVEHLRKAGERIAEQEDFIQKLREAIIEPWALQLQPNDGSVQPMKLDMVHVDRRDYEALQAVKALLNSRK